ncbi:MAG: hypothetical protein M0P11_06335 [Anaerolineaceae bacterium]|nr:hypothetical protein [Anaerolineaceae bacterium]
MIGDFLITFGGGSESPPARARQPWSLSATLGVACLYLTQSDDQWQGFPMLEAEDALWKAWLLGEFYEKAGSLSQWFEHPEKLNGHFLLVGYEKTRKQVHVITDRLGTIHVYHAKKGAKAALGTFSPAVAHTAGREFLDFQAMAEFFHFGFFLNDSTYWQEVRLMPGATHTIIDGTGQILSQSAYWHWHYQPVQGFTTNEAIDQFQGLFREVLCSQVKNKRIALPLSGGLDSRSTLAELGKDDLGGAAQIYLFSYGYTAGSVETTIARQLGNLRGMPVRTWDVQPYLFDQLERVCASVEGFQDITLCRQAYVIDELAANADFVVAAHWGDVWLDDMGFLGQKMLPDDRLSETIVNKYAKKGSEILLKLFSTNLPFDWEVAMAGKIQDKLTVLSGIDDLDFKVKAWKTSDWSFRWTLSSLRMFQAGLFPLLPFYDNRLVDFFLRVPGEMVVGRKLQIDYLKRYAPDLAKVNWQPYNANLYQYQNFNTWLLPHRAIQKLKRILFPQPITQRNWEVQFLNKQGRSGLKVYLLEHGLKLHQLFSVKDLQQLLNDFYQEPDASRGYAVSMLLTVSAWLEQYG